MPGREDLPLECLAAAYDVPDPFLRLRGDAFGRELTRAIEAREIRGIAFVVLSLNARALGNERRRDDRTRVSSLAHRAMQHVAGAAGVVAGAERAVP